MAQSKNNVITHGLTGLVGDMLVFRNRGGKTFVSSNPKKEQVNHPKVRNYTMSAFKKQFFMQKVQPQTLTLRLNMQRL